MKGQVSRCSMLDAAKWSVCLLVNDLPVDAFGFFPQITQIDADNIL
jgi:hypothetical protein